MNAKLLIAAIAIIILIALPLVFYHRSEMEEKERAIERCVDACREAMMRGKDLSNGPCLLESIPGLEDWVCDVAHWPRQDIDNLPENQCSSFREGKAKHFVEVDTSCKLIRVYP